MTKIKMKTKEEGHGGLSVAGRPYDTDDEGVIEVAAEHVEEAKTHGFEVIPERKSGGRQREAASGKEEDLTKMRISELRIKFAERFKVAAPDDWSKEEIIDALQRGWVALSASMLREAHGVVFSNENGRGMNKSELVDALEASKEK